MLNIYHIEKYNYVNGNGCRYVLWLQGCNLGCIGCWNKETWSFKKNILRSVDEVFEEIKEIKDKIDGVTFTGGEPMLQAKELIKLAKKIKKINLGLQIFTGFETDELNETQKELLKYTDVLVSGRFDETKENNNQKVYCFNEEWIFNNSDVEIDISDDGTIKLTGYPKNNLIKEIKNAKI
ncbi:4Fe-4S single cluster domain-containing protein [Nautilia sp.]